MEPREYEIPLHVKERLINSGKNMQREFEIIWGALSPSPERDEIMWHLMTAKHKLNLLLEVKN